MAFYFSEFNQGLYGLVRFFHLVAEGVEVLYQIGGTDRTIKFHLHSTHRAIKKLATECAVRAVKFQDFRVLLYRALGTRNLTDLSSLVKGKNYFIKFSLLNLT
jgi:hypothetical protein